MSPDTYTPYDTRNGEIVDPPTIPMYERIIAEAAALADQAQLDMYQDEYHQMRGKIADRHNAVVQQNQAANDAALAMYRANQAALAEQNQAQRQADSDRALAEKIRAGGTVNPNPADMTVPTVPSATPSPVTPDQPPPVQSGITAETFVPEAGVQPTPTADQAGEYVQGPEPTLPQSAPQTGETATPEMPGQSSSGGGE